MEDIDNYRTSLTTLNSVNKADCLPNEITDNLEDQPCENVDDYFSPPGNKSNSPNMPKLAKKCDININTTTDGVIMPVCVPNLDRNAVLSNYTKSNRYAKYVNSSKYTMVGVGSENDWMVLILSTNTSTGSFSAASSLLAVAWKGQCLLTMLFGSLILLF